MCAPLAGMKRWGSHACPHHAARPVQLEAAVKHVHARAYARCMHAWCRGHVQAAWQDAGMAHPVAARRPRGRPAGGSAVASLRRIPSSWRWRPLSSQRGRDRERVQAASGTANTPGAPRMRAALPGHACGARRAQRRMRLVARRTAGLALVMAATNTTAACKFVQASSARLRPPSHR